MNFRLLSSVMLLFCVNAPLAVASPAFLIQPEPDSPTGAMEFVWETEPGVRYDLWTSGDLKAWTHKTNVSQSPAEGLSKSFAFPTTDRMFFRVDPIDEQPPVIVAQFPAPDGFGMGRFADIVIELYDASEIEPASVSLTVGDLGPFGAGSPGLTVEGNTITFDSGDASLGAWGETVTVTLRASDVLGNALNSTWSFRLELQPEVAGNVFVFGSPTAQRAGQQVRGPAAALAARLASGPVRMNASAASWTVASVEADRIVIDYTPGSPPAFVVGQLVCNLTPTADDEIFYRRVLAVVDNSAASQITLTTEDALLTDFVSQGAAALSENSVIYEMDEAGTLLKALSVTGKLTFPRIGFDLSGSRPKLRPDGYQATVAGVSSSLGSGPPWIDVHATNWSWWFTPRIRASLEIKRGSLESFEAIASGTINTRNAFNVDVLLTGAATETTIFDLPTHLEPRHVIYIGQLGVVPVFAVLKFDFKIKTRAAAQAVIDYSFAYDQDLSAYFGIRYTPGSGVEWLHRFQSSPADFDYDVSLTGKFSLRLTLEPEPQFLVYGLAGFLANIEPHAGIAVEASTNGQFGGDLSAGIDFTLALAGPAFGFIPAGTQLSIPLVEGKWSLTPSVFAFQVHPQSQTVVPGADVSLTATVDSSSAPSFQWFDNGRPIPGQISRTLFLPRVNLGHAGNYFVRARVGGQSVDSNTATLTVQTVTAENRDTDGDGLPDVVETKTGSWVSSTDTGTDPLLWNSDGDGLRDGVETRTFVYVSRSDTGTDPNLFDTDADGVGDMVEIDAGMNPVVGLPRIFFPGRVAASDGPGSNASFFVKSDGALWGMGGNYSGQLGDGTTSERHTPIQIDTEVSQVSAGAYHTAFIRSDGVLWGMGANSDGQLGDGTTENKFSSVQIATGL